MQFGPDGRELYYLEGGRIQVVGLESRQVRTVAVSAELDVAFTEDRQVVFRQAWKLLRDFFYDEQYHGANWVGLEARFAPYVAGAATPEELRRILSLMIGELDASHLGISGPGFPPAQTGRLGLRLEPGPLEQRGRFQIAEVFPHGPAALAGGFQPGDLLLELEGQPLGSGTNLDALLQHRIGRRTEVTVGSGPDGAGRRTVVVRPISPAAERELLYRQWVDQRREAVRLASGGRLGYVHMPDMGQPSLQRLFLDLDALNQACEGVVVDLRHNQGGFVNAYALDVFTRRPYIAFRERGFPPSPARTALGQRALELPTVLLTNQHSLSDAEDFTEGYRTLKLGKVVGEPTAGWIIYTSNLTLLDGSSLRVPFIEVRGADGKVMERNPRPVDLLVRRPVGESYSGADRQLEQAVRTLVGQLPRRE
ncbi:MAG: PDZ domain-containing protein [Armatimonadetes bacterium]|nr:PDZ domain-containing protein [Armatimonadota bacterium]